MSLSTADQTMPPVAPAESADGWLIRCCEHGWVPDNVIRFGMRQLMRQRLREEASESGNCGGLSASNSHSVQRMTAT